MSNCLIKLHSRHQFLDLGGFLQFGSFLQVLRVGDAEDVFLSSVRTATFTRHPSHQRAEVDVSQFDVLGRHLQLL